MLVEKRPPFRSWHRCLRAGRRHWSTNSKRCGDGEADESNQASIENLINQFVEGGLMARLPKDDQCSPRLLAAMSRRGRAIRGEMRALESIGRDHDSVSFGLA